VKILTNSGKNIMKIFLMHSASEHYGEKLCANLFFERGHRDAEDSKVLYILGQKEHSPGLQRMDWTLLVMVIDCSNVC
jgi:hypothetical protein